MSDKPPLISVIIPTYNSQNFIQACIDSIKKQKYKNFEIIVVDQSSTDKTPEIVKKNKIKLITLPKPNFYSPPTKSRNQGAKAAKGTILYHLDSDMTLSKNLLSEAAEIFTKEKEIGAIIVHEEDITKGYWSKCKAFERKCYWGNDSIESARLVRASIFKKVKGYDEKLSSGEDFDTHRRYKKISKIGYCNNVVYHNLGELKFGRMIYKKYSYGKTANKYFEKHETSGVSLLGEQFKCYVKNYSAFFKEPLIGAGSVSLKLAEFSAGGFGLVVGNFTKSKTV